MGQPAVHTQNLKPQIEFTKLDDSSISLTIPRSDQPFENVVERGFDPLPQAVSMRSRELFQPAQEPLYKLIRSIDDQEFLFGHFLRDQGAHAPWTPKG